MCGVGGGRRGGEGRGGARRGGEGTGVSIDVPFDFFIFLSPQFFLHLRLLQCSGTLQVILLKD